MRRRAIDINLAHHGETHTVIELAKLEDLVVVAGVLRAKLVARKAQHRQALAGIAFVEFLQAAELRREAAFTGCVDDQQNLAFELRQRDVLAIDLARHKIVNGGGAHQFTPAGLKADCNVKAIFSPGCPTGNQPS